MGLRYLMRKSGQATPFVVSDVGAHTGLYTEQVLSVFGDRAEVYCFERFWRSRSKLL
jgi:hypothetical protein